MKSCTNKEKLMISYLNSMKNYNWNQWHTTNWLFDFFLFVVFAKVFSIGIWCWFFFSTMFRLDFIFSISFIRLSMCSSNCTLDSFFAPFPFFIVLLLWLCSCNLLVPEFLSPNDSFVVLLFKEYFVRFETWVVLLIGTFLYKIRRFCDSFPLEEFLAGFSYR